MPTIPPDNIIRIHLHMKTGQVIDTETTMSASQIASALANQLTSPVLVFASYVVPVSGIDFVEVML